MTRRSPAWSARESRPSDVRPLLSAHDLADVPVVDAESCRELEIGALTCGVGVSDREHGFLGQLRARVCFSYELAAAMALLAISGIRRMTSSVEVVWADTEGRIAVVADKCFGRRSAICQLIREAMGGNRALPDPEASVLTTPRLDPRAKPKPAVVCLGDKLPEGEDWVTCWSSAFSHTGRI